MQIKRPGFRSKLKSGLFACIYNALFAKFCVFLKYISDKDGRCYPPAAFLCLLLLHAEGDGFFVDIPILRVAHSALAERFAQRF